MTAHVRWYHWVGKEMGSTEIKLKIGDRTGYSWGSLKVSRSISLSTKSPRMIRWHKQERLISGPMKVKSSGEDGSESTLQLTTKMSDRRQASTVSQPVERELAPFMHLLLEKAHRRETGQAQAKHKPRPLSKSQAKGSRQGHRICDY